MKRCSLKDRVEKADGGPTAKKKRRLLRHRFERTDIDSHCQLYKTGAPVKITSGVLMISARTLTATLLVKLERKTLRPLLPPGKMCFAWPECSETDITAWIAPPPFTFCEKNRCDRELVPVGCFRRAAPVLKSGWLKARECAIRSLPRQRKPVHKRFGYNTRILWANLVEKAEKKPSLQQILKKRPH